MFVCVCVYIIFIVTYERIQRGTWARDLWHPCKLIH